LKVKTRRFWLGNEQPHPFQVHATPAAKRGPQTKNAEFVNRALIPNWLLPVLGAVLAVALVLVLLIPRIFNTSSGASTLASTPIVTPTATPTPVATPTPTAIPTPTPVPPIINFSSFTDTNGSSLQLNSSAQIVPSALRLTPIKQNIAGSAYYKQPIDASKSFQTHFQFFLHDGTRSDGISFIVQNIGLSALGESGGNLGYGGLASGVEVEFDTFQNGEWDPDNNHIGIMSKGNPINSQSLGTKSLPSTLSLYGSPLNAWIDYDAPSRTLQVYIDPGSARPSSPFLSVHVNIGDRPAFVGFTGGTGGFAANQDILNWQFSGKSPAATGLLGNTIGSLDQQS
jgi:hypothetical protein